MNRLRALLGREPVARSRADQVKAAHRLQVATVAAGCALIAVGVRARPPGPAAGRYGE